MRAEVLGGPSKGLTRREAGAQSYGSLTKRQPSYRKEVEYSIVPIVSAQRTASLLALELMEESPYVAS
jgi:hypothetical protein